MIRLTTFLKPFALLIGGVLILLFAQAMSDLYLPTLMADIVDTGIVKGDTDYIWQVGQVMLLVAGIGAVCSVAASFLSARIATGFGRDLRSRVFTQVTGYSLHEIDKLGTATLITRTTNDINQVQLVYLIIMRMMIYAPIIAIGGIIMAVREDAPLSLVLVVVVPVLALVIAVIAYFGVPLFRLLQKRLDILNRVLREELTGIRVIRAFNRTDYEQQRFADANRDLADVSIRVNRIMGLLMPVLLVMMNLTSIAIIWFGGQRIDSGGMQVGSLMAFIQYVMQIMFALLMLSLLFVMVPRAQASAVRLNEVLGMVSELNDPLRPLQPVRRGTVEFQDVTFSYPGAEQPALNHISFKAVPGQFTALIGGTGSGKSTLVNLLPRFYDVDSGHILIDGADVRELTQEDLRARIGFVPQQAVLFTGTIADNIRYGKPDATEAEVEHAADIAQASEFVTVMPAGFDSVIAQGGTNLSGGQKQRLSIARALVRRPEIYIFDDTFSALDFKTDAKLRRALKRETGAATVLVVAQRVSTVLDADQIIVLDEGAISGIGTHRELMKTCEVYREIVASQLSEEELAA